MGPRPLCPRFPGALLVGPARVQSGSDMGPPSSHVTAKFLIHCSCCCPLFIKNELELCTWELIGVCMLVNRTSWRCSSFVSMSVSGWPSVEEEVLIIRVVFVCLITGRG